MPAHRWVSIVGARPQFVKLAPVERAIAAHNNTKGTHSIEHTVIHTGQHYDDAMSAVFFQELAIAPPHYNLEVGSAPAGKQIGEMLVRLEPVLAGLRPDWVLVYGDTNSTLAGALIAARLGLALAHIEAGCRSYQWQMCEEQNRIVADQLSRLLLVPSQQAHLNLQREGIGVPGDPLQREIVFTGDLMLDVLLAHREAARALTRPTLRRLGLRERDYYLLTLHRAENTDDAGKLLAILRALEQLDSPVLFPVHPRTAAVLERSGFAPGERIRCIPPVSYLEMLALQMRACKVLTDSGGVQKEALYLHVPCVTLRDETEWPETVACGANRLAGTLPEDIVAAALEPQDGNYAAAPFGDGHAAQRIVDELLRRARQSDQTPAVTAA